MSLWKKQRYCTVNERYITMLCLLSRFPIDVIITEGFFFFTQCWSAFPQRRQCRDLTQVTQKQVKNTNHVCSYW